MENTNVTMSTKEVVVYGFTVISMLAVISGLTGFFVGKAVDNSKL